MLSCHLCGRRQSFVRAGRPGVGRAGAGAVRCYGRRASARSFLWTARVPVGSRRWQLPALAQRGLSDAADSGGKIDHFGRFSLAPSFRIDLGALKAYLFQWTVLFISC